MKKSFQILAIVLLMGVFLTGCTKAFNHYEDKLYSEKTIFGDKNLNIKTTNILTRENAIKKVLDIFDKGLNVKIDRTELNENIRLVKDHETGNLLWQITWEKEHGKMFYSCLLDSATGKVIGLQWYGKSNLNKGEIFRLSDSEIKSLIEPLFKQLDIDINEYLIALKSRYDSNTYQNIILSNKNDNMKEYTISIDLVNKLVIGFEDSTKTLQQTKIGDK